MIEAKTVKVVTLIREPERNAWVKTMLLAAG
jgi:hypothetical protein